MKYTMEEKNVAYEMGLKAYPTGASIEDCPYASYEEELAEIWKDAWWIANDMNELYKVE